MKASHKTILIIIAALIVGFFLGMQYKAYQVRSALLDGLDEIGESFSFDEANESLDNPEEEQVYFERSIGDEVQLATINVNVNSAEETNTISTIYGGATVAKNGAKFVVVNVDMTNTTNSPFTYFDDFYLVDDKGREFPPYDSIGNIDNYLSGRDLSPDITENGMMVYEIPEGSTGYYIPFGKAGTNETYNVSLD